MRLSCDDGCTSDMRVAALAKKYDIEAVFYLPVEWRSLAYDKGYEPLTFKQAVSISKDFEIGSHTITHRHLTRIPEDDALIEIAESKQILAEMFNQPIDKFCPPRGYINTEQTLFASQFYKSMRLTKGEELVHIHPDSGANANRPWRDCINDKTEEIWCHSWELDKYNLWSELEEVLSDISS